MGISSLIVWTFMPPNPLSAFAFSPFANGGNFWSLLIAVVPRVLFPLIVRYIYDGLQPFISIFIKNSTASRVVNGVFSAAFGTLMHTIMVLGGIWIVFRNNGFLPAQYVEFIIMWAGVNAIVEMITAGIVGGLAVGRIRKAVAK
jgi:uncharacterized membrane protein